MAKNESLNVHKQVQACGNEEQIILDICNTVINMMIHEWSIENKNTTSLATHTMLIEHF